MKSTFKTAFARRLSFAVAALWLLITIATPMAAQYRGSLQGTVTDPQGGVSTQCHRHTHQQRDKYF